MAINCTVTKAAIFLNLNVFAVDKVMIKESYYYYYYYYYYYSSIFLLFTNRLGSKHFERSSYTSHGRRMR